MFWAFLVRENLWSMKFVKTNCILGHKQVTRIYSQKRHNRLQVLITNQRNSFLHSSPPPHTHTHSLNFSVRIVTFTEIFTCLPSTSDIVIKTFHVNLTFVLHIFAFEQTYVKQEYYILKSGWFTLSKGVFRSKWCTCMKGITRGVLKGSSEKDRESCWDVMERDLEEYTFSVKFS